MVQSQDRLEWRDGQPVSSIYDDIYFSRESGIAETQHVFLHHNHLADRWARLDHPVFTIGETGFGTGLNFLCAWKLWRDVAPTHAHLHFVSTEKYPLSFNDLSKALTLWPALEEFSSELLAQYRMLAPGWRRMSFDDGRVTLTLLIGDARDTLPALVAQVDAWFLDGFAPAKNPDMWGPELLREIARLSSPDSTFATFTSAGIVRRGLEAVGFSVEKVAGYGRKREMLRGYLAMPRPRQRIPDRHAIVIGGGIAGTASAHSLASRGWKVTLIERHPELATEASGNHQGVLYPRLSGHDIPLSRVAQQGFLHTLSLTRRLLVRPVDWDDCGLLQQAFNAREAKRCEEVLSRELPADLVHAVDAEQAGHLTGMAMPDGGLWFPSGGWIHPPALCAALAQSPGIEILRSTQAMRLERHEEAWSVICDQACIAQAPVVILAGANETAGFDQTAHLPLEPVRGQVTLIPATADSRHLKAVVCTDGYVSPARQAFHCAGATFEPGDRNLEIRGHEHAQNLHMLEQLSPAFNQSLGVLDPTRLEGRAALRCVTPDYLPMAGRLLDAGLTTSRYTPGSRLDMAYLPWLEGLYVNTGHGSKGLLTAPLCAEIIAAQIENEPLPVDAGLARALDPNRFLLRTHGLKRLIGAALG